MKNLFYAIIICLLAAACTKNDNSQMSLNPFTKRILTDSEMTLKVNLDKTAMIIAEIIQDNSVMNEIALLASESRTFYSLPFRSLLDESKGSGIFFKTLREKFIAGCSAFYTKGNGSDLAEFLAGNDCYIYCPYPLSFYPDGTNSFTVAGHPIDNDIENKGYRFEGKKMIEVTVNEEYADKFPVILIMPKDEDNEDVKGMALQTVEPSKGDPVYEVRIGRIRCANYCGGLFEGELELRIGRGYPEYNSTTGVATGKMSTVIPINYPRSYARAAIRDYTVHSEAGWFYVYLPWDTNWKIERAQQCILVYEYDTVKETTLTTTVGYKTDVTSPTISGTLKVTYNGDFLGLVEWDRDWFYRTNTNPGPYDEVKDGLTVRKTCPEFKLTTPARTIY